MSGDVHVRAAMELSEVVGDQADNCWHAPWSPPGRSRPSDQDRWNIAL